MAANVESTFYVRETPWHVLGVRVREALSSADALIQAGLDWKVLQEPIYTVQGEDIEGYKVNVRDSDRKFGEGMEETRGQSVFILTNQRKREGDATVKSCVWNERQILQNR